MATEGRRALKEACHADRRRCERYRAIDSGKPSTCRCMTRVWSSCPVNLITSPTARMEYYFTSILAQGLGSIRGSGSVP